MKNAHLRFGWLTYIKSTEKTTTSIRLYLDRFIGELSPDPPRQAKAHLISVIGGDTQIAAITAAVSLADKFIVEGPGMPPTRVCLDRNAEAFKGSIQIVGRNKPLRHLVAISEEFAVNSGSSNTGRALLAGSGAGFILESIAETHGLPSIPEWSSWFKEELSRHNAIVPALGIGCSPITVRADKEQLLDWLSWGVESEAIRFPTENGRILWPDLTLKEMFVEPI